MADAVATPASPSVPKEAPQKRMSKTASLDPKLQSKIDQTLEKYEQASWERFLKEEEEFKRQVFTQFAADENADSLSITEYHQMLMRWHKMARWCMPSDLRPADSLACLEYILQHDKEAKEGKGGGEASGAAGGAGGGTE